MPSSVTAQTQTSSKASSTDRQKPVTEVLTLRLVPRRKQKVVKWAEDVVDNEGMGKKSSKKCCIFHKQRQPGDWDSSSDDSDEDSCSSCKSEEKERPQ